MYPFNYSLPFNRSRRMRKVEIEKIVYTKEGEPKKITLTVEEPRPQKPVAPLCPTRWHRYCSTPRMMKQRGMRRGDAGILNNSYDQGMRPIHHWDRMERQEVAAEERRGGVLTSFTKSVMQISAPETAL